MRGKAFLRKGDMVEVISGDDRGKRGRVRRVFPGRGKVIVEKVNLIKKHTRPSAQNRQGGIIEKESPLDWSNLLLYCSKCNKGVKVGVKVLEDGTKVRFCRKCKEMIGR